MASRAAELGPFAPEQGATSPSAMLAAILGVSAAGIAVLGVLVDATGGGALRIRPLAGLFGVSAVIAAASGAYYVSAYGSRGKRLAVLGAVIGLAGAVTAFLHQGIQSGTLDLKEFGVAYFDREILANIWGDIRRAAVNTVKYAALAEGFGIALGLVVATLAISKRRALRVPATIYVDVVRGLPLLMLLLLVYFGPGYVGITWPSSIVAGIVALTINSSAYVAEIFRAGIQSVEKGQMDAARSLGMPYATAMIHVVIPQAFRRVIPPLTNEFIALVKDTSLLLIIGMTVAQRELLTAARQLSSDSFSATPYMAASLMYLVITLPLTRLVTFMERRLLSGERRLLAGERVIPMFQSQRPGGRVNRLG
jgi:His/Glu/Gln/Arg/opine family amino acid ABC transporter permease subunit